MARAKTPTKARKKLVPFTLAHWREWTKGIVLDTGDPWESEDFQDELIEHVFEGVREILFVVPEENTKTTTLAGLCLYFIAHTKRAKVVAAASARDQAREGLFGQAQGMVESSGLSHVFVCQEGFLRVKHPATGSRLQITASDAGTGDGAIPNLVAVDELHRHKDLSYYRTLRGKLGKRGGQMVTISTAGEPGSEFELLRADFRAKATSKDVGETHGVYVGPSSVLIEWCVPELGDPHDLELVKRANPFSGITVESLREKHDAPGFNINHWRRLVCNQPTRSESSAITDTEWTGMLGVRRPPAGKPIWAGLDVGWKRDETGLVSLYAPSVERRVVTAEACLIPPRKIDEQLDPEDIKEAIEALNERNPIEVMVMDTSDARDIASWIEKSLGIEVVDRQQTNPKAVEDYQRWMEAMRNGWLRVAESDFLDDFQRHALNAVARLLPLGDSRFDRPAEGRLGRQQSRRVIDLLTAAAAVHSVWAAELEVEEEPDPLPMVSYA